jgi:hypothetical protein
MAGTKGHSGRKTHYEEKLISELVNLSVKTCLEYLRDKDTPKDKKAELAKHFAVKAIPNKVEGNLEISSLLGAIHKTEDKIKNG